MSDQYLERAMLLTGSFEGSDPWANITGNFDDAGLTCGQLGKTIQAGDQQAVVKNYLADHGDSGLLALMPRTGSEYLRAISRGINAGMDIVKAWSDSRGRVRQPYAAELAAFWKSPRMIVKQREHAAANEGKNTAGWLTKWNGDDTFQEYALFFDIAAQNGSLKDVTAKAVDTFIDNDPRAAIQAVIQWVASAPSGTSGFRDARANAKLWPLVLAQAGPQGLRLFVLAYLRSRKAKAAWQWDTMNRKGSFAAGEGWVHGTKWNLLDRLNIAGPAEVPIIDIPPKAIFVEFPAGFTPTTSGVLFRIAAPSGLDLCTTPEASKKDKIIGTFPHGMLVRFLANSTVPSWWQVSVDDAGKTKNGFIDASRLSRLASSPEGCPIPSPINTESSPVPGIPASASAVVEVHLPNPRNSPVRRTDTGSRAHKLNEASAPLRDIASSAKRVASFEAIISWLNPEGFARYLPGNGQTYCNIYAYDFTCLAGVYIPRIWWTQKAIHQLTLGASVNIKYEDTVSELTANDLQRWFLDWGGNFGWSPVQKVDALQNHANRGGVAVIVARNSRGHGHITLVVPESDDHSAKRDSSGTVTIPVESQAGAKNHNHITKNSAWWTASNFTTGFWIHA